MYSRHTHFFIPSWLSRHFWRKHPIAIRFLSEELPFYIVFTVLMICLSLLKMWKNHIWSSMQNEQKANTFYRTSSEEINWDRTPRLDHWTPTAEVLWNILQAVLFFDSSQNSAREVHTCLWKHIFFTNIQLYLATKTTFGGKMQLVLPTTTQSGNEVNWYTWQSPALFPSQVLVISWKICWLLKLKSHSEL